MTRSLYAGRAGDTVVSVFTLARRQVLTLPVDTNGNPAAVTLEVYDAVDGTRLTDLLAADGVTPISVVTASATDGQVPAFHGPDGVNTALFLRDPDGDYIRVEPDAATSADVAAGHASAAAADRALTQLARDTAETAAGQASTSALDAADFRDAAALSETNAATSESNAGNSAAAALVSETNAADSEALAAEHRAAVEGVVATSAGVMAAVDADPASDFRVQQEARLTTTYAGLKGARIQRTLGRLRNGDALKVAVIGDSKLDPSTPGNTETTSAPTAGDAVAKALTLIDVWSTSAVTTTNVAQSGHTAARQSLDATGVALAVAAVPDLVFIELGTNDSNSDLNGNYAAGYPMAASLASIERMCAYFRDANEACEFVFLATTPYVSGSLSNPKIQAYNTGLKALAATVGAEFVDLYTLFADHAGGYAGLMYDSTHRNAAGNDVVAAEIAAHFPSAGPVAAPALAPRPIKGRYDISKVDKTKGSVGYQTRSAQGADADGSYALNGSTSGYLSGWAASGTFDVTSTVNDYFELTGTKARELLVNVDLNDAAGGAGAVVDVYLDGVLQAANVDLHAQSSKNTTNYWVPFVTGLDGASHTLKLVLKSGTLRISSAVIVVGATASFTPETKLVTVGTFSTITALPTDGTYATAPIDATISKPAGWTSMDVLIVAEAQLRVSGATTEERQINVRVRHASTSVKSVLWDEPAAVASGKTSYNGAVAIPTKIDGATGNTQYRIDARVLSTTKTNCYIVGCSAYAILTRTA